MKFPGRVLDASTYLLAHLRNLPYQTQLTIYSEQLNTCQYYSDDTNYESGSRPIKKPFKTTSKQGCLQ